MKKCFMGKQKVKVLVVATSRKTRGGITSVVKAHETGGQWKKYHCKWIQTHRDGPAWRKLWYLFTAIIKFVVLLPWYDIVHIHVATTQSARRKKIFFELSKMMGKKTILHFHPSNEKFLYELHNKILYRNLFSRADLVLVLSGQWRRWIKDALGVTERIEVLYNPCPNVSVKPELKHNEILFAGTVIPRKGYDCLIKGFAKIAHKYEDWKVVIAGNGEIDKAKGIAIECGVEHQVEFLGWVSGKKKEEAFQRASVYCLASDGEGFPMGVLDAWAYGIPCVVTPVGGLPDIVKDGENALVFPVGDDDALASQLDRLLADEHLREKIAKASQLLACTTFNVDTINKQLGDIYDKVAGNIVISNNNQ